MKTQGFIGGICIKTLGVHHFPKIFEITIYFCIHIIQLAYFLQEYALDFIYLFLNMRHNVTYQPVFIKKC